MIHLKTKLLLFFMILILLISGLAFLLFQNNSRSIEKYNEILNRFFLLNEIHQKTNQVNGAIQALLLDDTQKAELQNYYNQRVGELEQLNDLLLLEMENESNYLTIKNYSNMIDSFLEEGRLTIKSVSDSDQMQYYDHMAQTGKIAVFIQDSTLKLINDELSNYQSFYINMNNQNDHYQKMAVFTFLAAVLLCTMFTVWFSEGITKPIHKLSVAARQISRGNFEVSDIIVSTRDELQFLTETFNSMCSNIRRLIQEIKQKSELDTLVKKMELRSLQNQINPHFLFNTLNMASKMAFVEGAEKTSELVESISALLRYNLRKLNHTVEIRDEVAIVREYLYIQKMRFGSRIAFAERVEEAAMSCSLPSLTLQPLIENAFVHGIESYESGAELELSIYRQNERVIVEIRDNGVGMETALIEELMNHSGTDYEAGRGISSLSAGPEHKQSNGVGLRNVIRRLQLFYQCEDVIEIASAPGKGTTITLKLPLSDMKEERIVYA